MGEAKAQKIVEYRNKHKFTSVDQIVEINGIGEKLLEKLGDQLTVGKKKQ
ncbi:MAG: helix-hairpin-helix domain-containing protein [Desulfuromusa sp.]